MLDPEKKEFNSGELKTQLKETEKKELEDKKYKEALENSAKEKLANQKEAKALLKKYRFKSFLTAITRKTITFHFKGMQSQIDELTARLEKLEKK